MFNIYKPMLAPNKATTEEDLDFSGNNYYLCTPKIDGVRVLKVDSHLVTRSFNEVKNDFIRSTLGPMLLDGCDGEIVLGDPSDDNFQETSGAVRRKDGNPDFLFCMFDYVKDSIDKAYEERVKDMETLYDKLLRLGHGNRITIIVPEEIHNLQDLFTYNEHCLEQGYEGVMLRSPEGRYKCGRATMKEQLLLKWKEFEDGEGRIVTILEGTLNKNKAEKDNFGRTKRSTHKENMIPSGMLGKFVVEDLKTGLLRSIGPGVASHKLRKEIWENKEDWVGVIIKFKHFAKTGVKDSLRFANFQGVRDEDDMS